MSYLGPSLRRRPRPSRAWPRLTLALALSLLANAALVRFVGAGILRAPPPQRAVAVAPLSASQWEANRSLLRATPTGDPAKRAAEILAALPPPAPPPAQAPGQVVDVAPSKDSTPPKDSRFLADRDNTVAKESVSRNRRAGFASTRPAPTDPSPGAKKPEEAPSARPGEVTPGERASSGVAAGGARQPARRDDASRDERLALNLDRFGEMLPQRERPPADASNVEQPRGDPVAPDDGGDGAARGGRAGPIDRSKLMPSASTYDRLAGGPAPDHVTGVDEGEGTFLNTREWKYASYFNRIKQAVASTWDPNRALGLRDPDGRRFAYRDRHTLVAVRLDDHGSLKDVEVVKSSGVDFLDQVALDAFRRAQPFVNPPRGLADPRGEIAFTFGFYLETGGGFRMYRPQR